MEPKRKVMGPQKTIGLVVYSKENCCEFSAGVISDKEAELDCQLEDKDCYMNQRLIFFKNIFLIWEE